MTDHDNETTEAETTEAAEGTAAVATEPTAEAQEQPPAPVEESPSPEELQRAFVALTRKRQRIREREESLARERAQAEQERQAWREREEALRRAREGDEDAARLLLGEDFLERIVRKRLDPQAAELDGRIRQELSLRDQKIAELREALAKIEHERTRSAAREEQQQFVAFAREAADDLGHLEDQEIVERAEALAAQARAAGRPVTFAQLRELIVQQERRALERYRAALAKREAKPAPQAATPAPRTITNREAVSAGASSADNFSGIDPEDAWKIPVLRELEERLRRR